MGDEVLAGSPASWSPRSASSSRVDWIAREPVRASSAPHQAPPGPPYDYPPDQEREAIDLVLKQMEIFAAEWAPGAK